MGQGGKDNFLCSVGNGKEHRVALVPRVSTASHTPQCWSSASCWTPWSSCSALQPQLGCQLGKSRCVYPERSFLARDRCRSGSPRELRRNEAELESRGFRHIGGKFGDAEWVLSVLWAGGCWETCLFSWLCFPSTAILTAGAQDEVWMQEPRLLCHCQGICFLYQLLWAQVTWLGSSNSNVLVPFLALTDIYSIRQKRFLISE